MMLFKIDFSPDPTAPKRVLRLIEGIRPRHPHVCEVSFSKSFEFATKSNTVPPFGEHGPQLE
jgi:hypothetical protein